MPDEAARSVSDLPVIRLEQSRTLADIAGQIGKARVVLVGETHTRYDHHLVQLEILKHLYQKSENLAVGVEWFQQPFQPHLDDYIAGKISEKQMLQRTEYFDRWSYDYRLYRPILQYLRENGIPLIALNASRELMMALHDTEIEDLSPALKSQLPESYDWSDKAYASRLREMYEMHPEYPGEFVDFMRGQLTWDESMAESVVDYMQQHPQRQVLVFAGSGHVMFGSGIPNRIKRRMEVDLATVLVSEDHLPVANDIADYLVMSARQDLEPGGLVGAFLKTNGKLLVVEGFAPDSAIEDAGLQVGAVIVGVDDRDVEDFTDFKLAVMDKTAGDSIMLHYLENAEAGSKEKKAVEIELR